MLLDELLRLDQGDTASYKPGSCGCMVPADEIPDAQQRVERSAYFEDVQGSMDNMNQVIPLEFAQVTFFSIRRKRPRLARAFAAS